MHRMSCEQAAGQGSLAGRIEQPCQLLQVDRNAFLIAVGASRTDGENTQALRSSIEGGNEVPVHLVRRETPCLVGAEAPVCNEHRALTDRGIRDQVGVYPHGDVETDMFGVVQHEVAQVEVIGRRGRYRLGLLLHRRMGENFVGRVQDASLRVWEQAITSGAEQPRGHGTNLFAATQGLEQKQLGFELLEAWQIQSRCLGIRGQLSGATELAPNASIDESGSPLPHRLGMLAPGNAIGKPLSLCRVTMSGRADEQPRRPV